MEDLNSMVDCRNQLSEDREMKKRFKDRGKRSTHMLTGF